MKPNDPQYAKSYKTNKDCIETITTRGEIFNTILQGKVNRSSHLNIYDIFKIYLISPKNIVQNLGNDGRVRRQGSGE